MRKSTNTYEKSIRWNGGEKQEEKRGRERGGERNKVNKSFDAEFR